MTTARSDVLEDSRRELLADGCITVVEAAKFLSLGKSTLYEAMDRGELAYVRIGRARRIPRRAVVAFAEARLTGGWAVANASAAQ